MALKADRLLYIAVIFAIIGILLFVMGPYLPIPSIIPLTLALICFIIVIVTVILALRTYQRGYVQSQGREVF